MENESLVNYTEGLKENVGKSFRQIVILFQVV